ncbi:glycoside hydrolase superfamily [Kockovaella imperatae]|uniref:Glycoside hydrolase superfamily n=1 Tax=Kockovaella imperatae TaxID=4999 RepID=A0A1Y1UDE8_9TREE|nr:glycoside hydrolase superfamily [Kockovaella imperatae]ORX36053.1 glycoside hydrolase superfamily [Kockovaella imperatae]
MSASVALSNDPNWWRQASVYQIYPRSFADGNGDGIGDLRGIISRIPYLQELGVDAIWLSPFYTSPQKDAGYDVADYRDVDPRFGTIVDFEEMVSKCRSVGIRTIVDLVPNHSSEEHPWFQQALKAGRGSAERARYHFRDGLPDGSPPADWDCSIGGCAWHPAGDGQYYFGLFGPFQPDLNWGNNEVREDFIQTIRFWADKGVAGFRVDVAPCLEKYLPEHLPSNEVISAAARRLRQNGCPPDIHPFTDRNGVFEIYKSWRKVFNEYDPPLMGVAEAWVAQDRIPLYADANGLGQSFSFDLLLREFDRAQYKDAIETSLKMAKLAGSSTTWVLSNHDMIRHATRYGFPKVSGEWTNPTHFDEPCEEYLGSRGNMPGFDPVLGLKRARAASLFMLGLPGSAYIYQGEELGLPEIVDIAPEHRQCPVFKQTKGKRLGRDGCRVPLPWVHSEPGFGFGGKPWIPQPDRMGTMSVDLEEKDPRSTLSLYRRALTLRRELQSPEEELEWIGENSRTLHYSRSENWEVIVNFSEVEIDMPPGKVLITSSDCPDGRLGPTTTAWLSKSASS